MALSAFEVESFATTGAGANLLSRDGIRLLSIGSDTVWGRPVRGAGAKVVYVSMGILASRGTVINIGGAVLVVNDGPIPNTATLAGRNSRGSEPRWQPVGIHVAWDQYDGKMMAALPVLTVRINLREGVWDLYAGSHFRGATIGAPSPSISRVFLGSGDRIRLGNGITVIRGSNRPTPLKPKPYSRLHWHGPY